MFRVIFKKYSWELVLKRVWAISCIFIDICVNCLKVNESHGNGQCTIGTIEYEFTLLSSDLKTILFCRIFSYCIDKILELLSLNVQTFPKKMCENTFRRKYAKKVSEEVRIAFGFNGKCLQGAMSASYTKHLTICERNFQQNKDTSNFLL